MAHHIFQSKEYLDLITKCNSLGYKSYIVLTHDKHPTITAGTMTTARAKNTLTELMTKERTKSRDGEPLSLPLLPKSYQLLYRDQSLLRSFTTDVLRVFRPRSANEKLGQVTYCNFIFVTFKLKLSRENSHCGYLQFQWKSSHLRSNLF